MIDNTYTLFDLLSEVRQYLKAAFAEAYWVIAEIAEAKEHQRGHCYLTLVERREERIAAQIKANIWAYEYRRLIQKFTNATGEGFKPGMKVLLLVTIDCHELYGMSFNIKDIEPSYTLGEMALKRREIIERLTREGLIEKNRSIPLPLAPQRIAIISSSQAAGYGDFMDQITNNPYGYRFKTTLFPALMQGEAAEESIIKALDAIVSSKETYDLLVIIRGGGSSIDLSCFDSYEISAKVANFPMPVITGIGHEKDETIVDMVAHTPLKTPTAVADFLLSGLSSFEEAMIGLYQRLKTIASRYLKQQEQRLNSLSARFFLGTRNFTVQGNSSLDMLSLRLSGASHALIARHLAVTEHLEQALRHLSPENVLKRGYSITTYKGKALKDIGDLKDGAEIVTQLKNFSFISLYKAKRKESKGFGKRQGIDLFSGIE